MIKDEDWTENELKKAANVQGKAVKDFQKALNYCWTPL